MKVRSLLATKCWKRRPEDRHSDTGGSEASVRFRDKCKEPSRKSAGDQAAAQQQAACPDQRGVGGANSK